MTGDTPNWRWSAGRALTGEYDGGKHRETWLPVEFEAVINRYLQERGLATSSR